MSKREKFGIRSWTAVGHMLFLWETLLIVLVLLHHMSMSLWQMALAAIVQALVNIIILDRVVGNPLVSIPNMFMLFSLLFHAGQIIKEGLNIPGEVPLPFELYGDNEQVQQAFQFYMLSQLLLTVGIYLAGKVFKVEEKSRKELFPDNVLWCGKVLLAIGVLPRLFIDLRALWAARSAGYMGVYSLYTPQIVGTLAFFFDAAMLFLLFGLTDKKRKILFIAVLLYKCIMMSAGSRQEKVGFLLVWLFLYYFVLQKINYKKMVGLLVFCVVGIMFIMAIGSVRATNSAGLAGAIRAMFSGKMANMIGNVLGEFGAALDTIIIAIHYAPEEISYGLGRTYIAGAMSVIPALVSKIPTLADTTSFTSQLSQDIVFSLGGSYLGELYYNFSWLGCLFCIPLGGLLAVIHGHITSAKNSTADKCWYAAMTTVLLLYVRGYFTDMVQQLVWLFLALIFLRLWETERINATYRMRERSRGAE